MEESMMVYDVVRPKLAKLGKLAKDLNEASDNFTAELLKIEEDLSQMNIGIEVEVRHPFDVGDTVNAGYDEKDQRPRATYRYLGYRKLDRGSWRIVVNEYTMYNPGGPDDFEPFEGGPERVLESNKPLVDCTREIRLAAAHHVEMLLNRIADDVAETISTLKNVSNKNKQN